LLYAGAFKRQAAKGLLSIAGVVVKADALCLQALETMLGWCSAHTSGVSSICSQSGGRLRLRSS